MTTTDLSFPSGLLLVGDCIERLAQLPDSCVDAIVTDPPYGIEFMGKGWDSFGPPRAASTAGRVGDGAQTGGARISDDAGTPHGRVAFGGGKPATWTCDGCGRRDQFRNPHACDAATGWTKTPIYEGAPKAMLAFQAWFEQVARECLRVLKPGGHLVSFGGTRTYHRMACAVEDAGFEVRDMRAWLYGQGFPKSMDVSKAIDKQLGAAREVVGSKRVSPKGVAGAEDRTDTAAGSFGGEARDVAVTAPASAEAQQWAGWGTAAKPAIEPAVLARKPLIGTVAENVLRHGTGALNIDATRITIGDGDEPRAGHRTATFGTQETAPGGDGSGGWAATAEGRWPTNVLLDEEAAAELDRQSGVRKGGHWAKSTVTGYGSGIGTGEATYHGPGRKDPEAGGASRFFYVAKPSTREREHGLAHLDAAVQDPTDRERTGTDNPRNRSQKKRLNVHPTVKPVALMRQLIAQLVPAGGVVLDPFLGSGTTAVAAVAEGVRWIGCEMTADYLPIIAGRVAQAEADRAAALANAAAAAEAAPTLFDDPA